MAAPVIEHWHSRSVVVTRSGPTIGDSLGQDAFLTQYALVYEVCTDRADIAQRMAPTFSFSRLFNACSSLFDPRGDWRQFPHIMDHFTEFAIAIDAARASCAVPVEADAVRVWLTRGGNCPG